MKAMTDEELEAIRERDKERATWHGLDEIKGTIASDRRLLIAEVDRLRHLDKLAREWLKRSDLRIKEGQAKEEYRAACEKDGK